MTKTTPMRDLIPFEPVKVVRRSATSIEQICADVAALKSAGHDEETLFELTVAAAVGAASHRCARALAALEACEAEGDLRSEP